MDAYTRAMELVPDEATNGEAPFWVGITLASRARGRRAPVPASRHAQDRELGGAAGPAAGGRPAAVHRGGGAAPGADARRRLTGPERGITQAIPHWLPTEDVATVP